MFVNFPPPFIFIFIILNTNLSCGRKQVQVETKLLEQAWVTTNESIQALCIVTKNNPHGFICWVFLFLLDYFLQFHNPSFLLYKVVVNNNHSCKIKEFKETCNKRAEST